MGYNGYQSSDDFTEEELQLNASKLAGDWLRITRQPLRTLHAETLPWGFSGEYPKNSLEVGAQIGGTTPLAL